MCAKPVGLGAMRTRTLTFFSPSSLQWRGDVSPVHRPAPRPRKRCIEPGTIGRPAVRLRNDRLPRSGQLTRQGRLDHDPGAVRGPAEAEPPGVEPEPPRRTAGGAIDGVAR